MTTILIKDDTDYLVNLYVESLVDPNGALIAPYHNDPKIEEIEKTLSEIYPYNEMVKPALKYFTNEKNNSSLLIVRRLG